MGQGQDKIARSLVDLQPTAIVELFQLYFNTVDKETAFIAFHGGAVFSKGIVWQGIEYLPIPVETEGFEVNANGQMARPKIRISNKDYFITDLLLNNQDLQFAKVIRKRTFVKYIDDVNFDGGNPWSDADASAEISNDTFVISQKTAENKVFVEFELSSPLDLENFEVNSRIIMSRYCSWYYRGNGCNYQGPPLETENGDKLILNPTSVANWKTLANQSQWVTGVIYGSGDPVFLENKKIIINQNPNDANDSSGYAKIWYVSKTGHTSSSLTQPDLNETYWSRDGCTKKLGACSKRFQNSERLKLGSAAYNVTNCYLDLTHKSGFVNSNSNSIAAQAVVTVSNEYSKTNYCAQNAVDLQTGSFVNGGDRDYSWAIDRAVVGTGLGSDPWITLTWPTSRTINRIDLFDRPVASVDFKNAYIQFYSGTTVIKSGLLTGIPENGSKITTGFSDISVSSIRISGSGCTNNNVGLGEIAVYEPSGVGFYNTGFSGRSVHQAENWHIASWFHFPNGVSNSKQNLNIFHNVLTNCPYSGLNVYASGNDYLIVNFATVLASGNPIQYYNRNKSIKIRWDVRTLQPLHIICSGGKVSGASPTTFTNGNISVFGLDTSASGSYSLLPPNKSTNVSGEFFLFKNNTRQAGIGHLKFGINDWQFSDSAYSLNPLNSGVYHNMKITSNMRLGTTAIWTGLASLQSRIKFFNREDYDVWDQTKGAETPRLYAEIPASLPYMQNNLFSWWDMDLSDTPIYSVTSSNNPAQLLTLSGQYYSGMDYSLTTTYNTTGLSTLQSIVQQKSDYLPFGGFPGTDKYGR